MFAYSGWNGASYIAGEIRDPVRNLPRAMLWGTLLTMCLYLLLNFVFLLGAPGQELVGQDEVAAIAAGFLFSPTANNFLTLGIALVLLSAVSVQLMIGPRVCYAMAQDRMLFQWIATQHPRYGTPWLAICAQMGLAIIYVLLGSALSLVIYMGFALSIFPVMAVIGMMYMRFKQPGLPRPYKVPLYPYIPLFFIVLSVTMMAAALMTWMSTTFFSISVLIAGIPVYYVWRYFVK
jgi:APA family basic amino acid/polyamine antiporter